MLAQSARAFDGWIKRHRIFVLYLNQVHAGVVKILQVLIYRGPTDVINRVKVDKKPAGI
jgi:hypothetical protein